MFVLFNVIFGAVVGFISGLLGIKWLASIYSLAVLVPSIAVSVRRLHDTGRSGWWLLIGLVPLIGSLWLIVLLCLDSQPETNKWGANPKA